ncbi:MAG: hypothetical protein AAGJ79_02115 [Verrucomicrobiota bacterium]
MSKELATIILAGALLAALVAGVFFSGSVKTKDVSVSSSPQSQTPENGPGPEPTPTPSASDPSEPEAATPSPVPPKRLGPVTDTVAGKRSYDIGVRRDPRMTHTDDGKHIFNEAVDMARRLHTKEISPEEDAQYLSSIIGFYRAVYRQNPEAGDNQSVMTALLGDNPRNIVAFPADHPSLNEKGQLLDRWESPYYFHPLSGTQMEVISLGPDQQLGTNDDVIHTQREASHFFRGITDDSVPGLDEEF